MGGVKMNSVDLIGKKFGYLEVIERVPDRITARGNKVQMWKCKCICGNYTVVARSNLTGGATISCGCKRRERAKEITKGGLHSKEWNLVSPKGEHYSFSSLANWMRKNGEELFGCKPDSQEMKNVMAGLSRAKKNGTKYKGWSAGYEKANTKGSRSGESAGADKSTKKSEKIKLLYLSGFSQSEIARHLGCSKQYVSAVLKRCGAQREYREERNEIIKLLYLNGYSKSKIARHLRCSTQYVSAVLENQAVLS